MPNIYKTLIFVFFLLIIFDNLSHTAHKLVNLFLYNLIFLKACFYLLEQTAF